MFRVIIRVSFNGDTGSKLRNALALDNAASYGLSNTSTGMYEGSTVTPAQLAALMQRLGALGVPADIAAGTTATLDHFMVYVAPV
ncbi:MAG: hypothetical protein DYG93_01865 [Leptolyngbya sp. PLA2]|nr:hypothetical protein [Leptolyngbya sp. PL-A2]MCQ3941040.1 hypothetical protein [cyanobacterium CYA1]MDL1905633.1 hypothetical protein [Synechococcales cyanobacterium CNB]